MPTRSLAISESQKELLKNMKPEQPKPKRKYCNREKTNQMKVLRELGLIARG